MINIKQGDECKFLKAYMKFVQEVKQEVGKYDESVFTYPVYEIIDENISSFPTLLVPTFLRLRSSYKSIYNDSIMAKDKIDTNYRFRIIKTTFIDFDISDDDLLSLVNFDKGVFFDIITDLMNPYFGKPASVKSYLKYFYDMRFGRYRGIDNLAVLGQIFKYYGID